MSIFYDCHLHSSFSADSETPAEAMIQRAISIGLSGMCFTEHLDTDCPPEGPDFCLDLPAYFEKLSALRERFRDVIDIRIGLEFGIQPQCTKLLPALAAQYPFDFIIASQHFIDGQDPYYPSFFEGACEETCYIRYFDEIRENLDRYSNFDTLGHLDYIVRYGPNRNREYTYRRYADHIDPILHRLIDRGKCLELNTGGLKYGLGEPNPCREVLKRYHDLGGELITIGSDAHAPEHIAYDFATAEAILKEIGFRYYTVFRERKAEQLPL